MTGWTPLWSEIVLSSIWAEDDRTRLLWITMLAQADYQGRVMASVPGIAGLARIPLDAARAGLATLLAPDPDSRSQEHEGRRIEEIPGGWRILNHGHYRAKMSELAKERRREYQRRWVAKKRKIAKVQTYKTYEERVADGTGGQ